MVSVEVTLEKEAATQPLVQVWRQETPGVWTFEKGDFSLLALPEETVVYSTPLEPREELPGDFLEQRFAAQRAVPGTEDLALSYGLCAKGSGTAVFVEYPYPLYQPDDMREAVEDWAALQKLGQFLYPGSVGQARRFFQRRLGFVLEPFELRKPSAQLVPYHRFNRAYTLVNASPSYVLANQGRVQAVLQRLRLPAESRSAPQRVRRSRSLGGPVLTLADLIFYCRRISGQLPRNFASNFSSRWGQDALVREFGRLVHMFCGFNGVAAFRKSELYAQVLTLYHNSVRKHQNKFREQPAFLQWLEAEQRYCEQHQPQALTYSSKHYPSISGNYSLSEFFSGFITNPEENTPHEQEASEKAADQTIGEQQSAPGAESGAS